MKRNLNKPRHNYVDRFGSIVINPDKPPTEDEYRILSLQSYITRELNFYTEIRSVLITDRINNRIAELVQARYQISQKQPIKLIEDYLHTHYSQYLRMHI